MELDFYILQTRLLKVDIRPWETYIPETDLNTLAFLISYDHIFT